jgi:predicted alpha-1,2-mannosidase
MLPRPSTLSEWVSTLQGTDSHPAFSTGNTLPLTTRPHGMVGWIPQTDPGRWPFDLRSPTIQGLRATHQPSPWNGDYGNLLVLVGSGVRPPLSETDGESPYLRAETIAQPHYFRTRLIRHEVIAEVAPSERGASLRLTYEASANAWLVFRPAAGGILKFDRDQRTLTAISTALGRGVPEFDGCFYAAFIGAPILDHGVFDAPVAPPAESGTAQGLWLKLALPADGAVTIKVATSFIDADQALLNLRRELGDRTFEHTLDDAHADWNRRLGVITIDGANEDQRRTFYGCLYRALLYPRIWHEYDIKNRLVHRSPFNRAISRGPLYTDCGFWDVHRTLTPLLTLIAPQVLNEMIQGWIHAFKEGGWLPSWSSPGYVPCMVGSHAGVVITDAYRKGLSDFDVITAYAAVRHDATTDPASFAVGRVGLTWYDELGWIPADRMDHAVARTCDYALADFAAAQFAAALGHREDAGRFSRRETNYRHLYDPAVGFLRGRNANGAWREPFSEFAWSSDYIEGGAWQYLWAAPHDAAGLSTLLGGDDAMVAKLDRMLSLPPRYEIGRYDRTIHEMTEMAVAPFGQYAHSNEPVHHALHLYTAAGRPDRAQYWVRRVLNELYSPHGFPGDEDNGAMGSWYVLNALGLFPLTPGHPAWVLGAPLFPRAVVQLDEGKTLEVRSENYDAASCHVSEVRLNGRLLEALDIPHAALVDGGELVFTMTSDSERARMRGRLRRPFSVSISSLR